MARISVIVPNFNGKRHLEECLRTLQAQDIAEPFDTILSDNGSMDGSVDFVRERFPNVRVLENGANVGFAAACNRAIRDSKGPFIVLLNNDTRLPTDWLRSLVQAADASAPDVFAIGSLLILYDHPDRINSSGGVFSPMGGGFDVGLGEPWNQSADTTPYETAIAPGAAVLYKRALYDVVGGLDDRFFLYFEDVEICYRAWKMGLRCLMAPAAKVFHKHGGTAGPRDSPVKVYWCQRNRFRSIARNQSGLWAAKSALVLGLYTVWKAAQCMGTPGRPALAPLLRATRDGLRDSPHYRRSFRIERARAKRSDRDLAHAGLVASLRSVLQEGARLRGLVAGGVHV